jgi:hypothetical protein
MDWYWRMLGIIIGLLILQMGFGLAISWAYILVGGMLLYFCIFTKGKKHS